jgi:hypothetical protein
MDFQGAEDFGAVAGFGKSHGALWTLLRLSGSSGGLCRGLGVGRKQGRSEAAAPEAKLKESIHGSIVHPTLARQSGKKGTAGTEAPAIPWGVEVET